MGTTFESPISRVVAGGAEAVRDYITNCGGSDLFLWMGLIYLKTHLKDRLHRVELDRRKGDQKIADIYEWEHSWSS